MGGAKGDETSGGDDDDDDATQMRADKGANIWEHIEEQTYKSTYMRAHIWEHRGEHTCESTQSKAHRGEHTYESTYMRAHRSTHMRSQEREPDLVRAGGSEIHMDMSEEQFCVEI